MIKALIWLRYRQARNLMRKNTSFVGGVWSILNGIALLLSFAFLCGGTYLLISIYPTLAASPSMFLRTLFGVIGLFSIVAGVRSSLANMYLSSSLEGLLSLPISLKALYGTFIAQFSLNFGLITLWFFSLGILIGYGLISSMSPAFYLAAALVIELAIVLGVIFGMLLISLVVWVIPAKSILKVFSYLGIAISGIIYLIVSLANHPDSDSFVRFSSALPELRRLAAHLPSSWIADTFQRWNLLSIVPLALAASGFILVVYLIFKQTYYTNYGRLQDQGSVRKQASSIRLYHTSSISLQIARKDWRMLVRDPKTLNMLVFPLLWLIVFAVNLSNSGFKDISPTNKTYLVGGIFAALSLVFSQVSTTGMGREGSNIAIIRSLPISTRQLLWGKWLVAGLPICVSSALAVLFTGIFFQAPWYIVLGTLAGVLITNFVLIWLCISLGTLYARYNAPDPARSVAPITTLYFILLAFWLASSAALFIAVVWLAWLSPLVRQHLVATFVSSGIIFAWLLGIIYIIWLINQKARRAVDGLEIA